PEGERGLLTVTSLGRDNPMLRYNNEDVVRIQSDPCPCGETFRRGFYEGRRQDIIRIDGKMILPIDVWFELPLDAEYEIVRWPHQDRLVVRIEHEPGDLVERLSARTGVPVEVDVVQEGTIPRASYKPTRVVDEDPAAHRPSTRSRSSGCS